MKSRRLKSIIKCILFFVATVFILNIPVTTEQGVNFEVSAKKIPLYVKLCGFLYRDYQYKDLSRRIIKNVEGDTEKVEAIYSWTIENIRKTPEGFPIVDDHIWDIIIRSYGTGDQMADVFTTLASYAGYEAFWYITDVKDDREKPILSFVRIGDRWSVFDVYNKEYFSAEGRKNTPRSSAYKRYLEEADKDIFKYRIRRPDRQKAAPRFLYELKKIFLRKLK